jgi:hypothetical protein
MLPVLVARLAARIAGPWRDLVRELTDPYRPELYYMRGPGPKCRERGEASEQAVTDGAE